MKSLFKSINDRNLWLKLNAENQIEWEKNLVYFDRESNSYKPTLQALNPRTMEEALIIAENQLKCDEGMGELRFSLEELLTLSISDLDKLYTKRIKKSLPALFRE